MRGTGEWRCTCRRVPGASLARSEHPSPRTSAHSEACSKGSAAADAAAAPAAVALMVAPAERERLGPPAKAERSAARSSARLSSESVISEMSLSLP